jgi:hypothetical protein
MDQQGHAMPAKEPAVKRLMAVAGVVLMLATCWPAAAQQHQPGRRGPEHAQGQGQRQGQSRPMPMPPQDMQRGQNREPPGGGRDQRMSQQEREQLRRDVQRHGQELYGSRK